MTVVAGGYTLVLGEDGHDGAASWIPNCSCSTWDSPRPGT
jgi:hypothetical protein